MERKEYDRRTEALLLQDNPGEDPRVDLWRGVLLQTGFEAVMHRMSTSFGLCGEGEFYVVRAQSRAWFRMPNLDFRLVCDYGALEPGYVLRVMSPIFARADAQMEAAKIAAASGKVRAHPRRRGKSRAQPFSMHVSHGQVAAV